MKKYTGLILTSVFLLGFLVGFIATGSSSPLGSIMEGGEYNSYYASSAIASSSPILLKTGWGSLGSIVVSSTTAATGYAPITVYDAASTTAATSTATVLVKFSDDSQLNGTYVYDLSFSTGLMIEVPAAFNGLYTITYR